MYNSIHYLINEFFNIIYLHPFKVRYDSPEFYQKHSTESNHGNILNAVQDDIWEYQNPQ